MIDFEQLKIENQSLNEKIEERNDELLRLRKKTTTSVLVLTHLKEKLQFVERHGAQLQVGVQTDGDVQTGVAACSWGAGCWYWAFGSLIWPACVWFQQHVSLACIKHPSSHSAAQP